MLASSTSAVTMLSLGATGATPWACATYSDDDILVVGGWLPEPHARGVEVTTSMARIGSARCPPIAPLMSLRVHDGPAPDGFVVRLASRRWTFITLFGESASSWRSTVMSALNPGRVSRRTYPGREPSPGSW